VRFFAPAFIRVCAAPVAAQYSVAEMPEMRAQSACGVVVDPIDAPIPHASVEEVKSRKQVFTDANGRLVLPSTAS
jgi:hypothetical protein